MACRGSHCTNHGTGTSTCTGHRAGCASNRVLPGTVPTSISGQALSADAITALKTYMNAEIDRYRQHRLYARMTPISATFAKNSAIIASEWTSIITHFFGVGATPVVGDPLNSSFWDVLISRYNRVRQDCICHSDCACNSVCTCHNNCNCNYSDRRLKQDIQYC